MYHTDKIKFTYHRISYLTRQFPTIPIVLLSICPVLSFYRQALRGEAAGAISGQGKAENK